MKYSIYNDLVAKLISRNDKDEFQFYKVDTLGDLSLEGSVFLDESVIDFTWGKASSSTKKREANGAVKVQAVDDLVVALLLSGHVITISSRSRTVVRHDVKIQLSHILAVEDNTIWGLSKGNVYKVELDGKSTKVKVPEFKSIVVKSGIVYIGTSSGLLIGKINKNTFNKDMDIETGFEVLSVEVLGSSIVAASQSKAVLVHDGAVTKKLAAGENGVKVQVAGDVYIISDDLLKVFTPEGDFIKDIKTSHSIDYVLTIDDTKYVSWHDGAGIHIQRITQDTNTISFQNGTSITPKRFTLIHIENNTEERDAEDVKTQLHEQLSRDKPNEEKISQLCLSLHNDDDVKQLVTDLSYEDVEKLFKITTTNMPIWLKWILLIHGNLIAKSSVSVKDLQQDLRSNVGTMPHLYAIKGKLQLLQLQSQIKDAPVDNDITTTVEDETMIYANGEVDENLNRL